MAFDDLRRRVESELGPIGVLCAFAGGGRAPQPITDIIEDEWRADDVEGAGDRKVQQVAEMLGLHERWVRLAVSSYAAHPEEVDERIAANEAAMERAREMAERHEQLLA